jgi:hypothetical protein
MQQPRRGENLRPRLQKHSTVGRESLSPILTATHGVVEKLEQACIDVIAHEAIEAQSCFPVDYTTTIAKTKWCEWLLPFWIVCPLLPPRAEVSFVSTQTARLRFSW